MNRSIFHCGIVRRSIGKYLEKVSLKEIVKMKKKKENTLWTSSYNDLGHLEPGPSVTCEIFMGKNSFSKLLENWSWVNLISN